MHVFTYGTLMFPEVWQVVVGRSFATVEGTAAGYAVYGVRNAAFPGMAAADDHQAARGVVYLDVDHAAVARLDLFEDDFYVRQTLSIACDDGQRRAADAYVVPNENRAVLTQDLWRADEFIASGGLHQFIERFAGFTRLAEE
jgi:gamma-glutamylcyclotransferase (GGCT)/AIG2-like uncharacterized protein YtfP